MDPVLPGHPLATRVSRIGHPQPTDHDPKPQRPHRTPSLRCRLRDGQNKPTADPALLCFKTHWNTPANIDENPNKMQSQTLRFILHTFFRRMTNDDLKDTLLKDTRYAKTNEQRSIER